MDDQDHEPDHEIEQDGVPIEKIVKKSIDPLTERPIKNKSNTMSKRVSFNDKRLIEPFQNYDQIEYMSVIVVFFILILVAARFPETVFKAFNAQNLICNKDGVYYLTISGIVAVSIGGSIMFFLLNYFGVRNPSNRVLGI